MADICRLSITFIIQYKISTKLKRPGRPNQNNKFYDQYRRTLVEAIFLMISSRQSYASIGMEICRLEELDFPEKYMDENEFEH